MLTAHLSHQACRDVREVGGKAAGLAAMIEGGFPVAPGFAVTARSYRAFLDGPGVRDAMYRLLHEPVARDGASPGDLAMEPFAAIELPAQVEQAIRSAYSALCEEVGIPDVAVAVRSSATAEDSVSASFAGEFDTWVDVVGGDEVVAHVRRCYLSVHSPRVLSYLDKQGIDPLAVEMAVVVQKTVRARSAGVMFTLSPVTGDRSKIVLEACWGLGLAVVGGEVTPDRFIVDKVGLAITERILGDKRLEYRRGDAPVPVNAERQSRFCLTDEEVTAIARFGKRLEAHHKASQDIEFALDGDLPPGSDLILLQCRPETIWSKARRAPAFDASAGMMSWITDSISKPAADGKTVAPAPRS